MISDDDDDEEGEKYWEESRLVTWRRRLDVEEEEEEDNNNLVFYAQSTIAVISGRAKEEELKQKIKILQEEDSIWNFSRRRRKKERRQITDNLWCRYSADYDNNDDGHGDNDEHSNDISNKKMMEDSPTSNSHITHRWKGRCWLSCGDHNGGNSHGVIISAVQSIAPRFT